MCIINLQHLITNIRRLNNMSELSMGVINAYITLGTGKLID